MGEAPAWPSLLASLNKRTDLCRCCVGTCAYGTPPHTHTFFPLMCPAPPPLFSPSPFSTSSLIVSRAQVARTHFHEFMLDVHSKLRVFKGASDPLKRVAFDIAQVWWASCVQCAEWCLVGDEWCSVGVGVT